MNQATIYFHAFTYDAEKITTEIMRDMVAIFQSRWDCQPLTYWVNPGALVTAEQPYELVRHRTVPGRTIYLEVPADKVEALPISAPKETNEQLAI